MRELPPRWPWNSNSTYSRVESSTLRPSRYLCGQRTTGRYSYLFTTPTASFSSVNSIDSFQACRYTSTTLLLHFYYTSTSLLLHSYCINPLFDYSLLHPSERYKRTHLIHSLSTFSIHTHYTHDTFVTIPFLAYTTPPLSTLLAYTLHAYNTMPLPAIPDDLGYRIDEER